MKNKHLLLALIGLMVVTSGVNVAAKDIGQNLSKGLVTSVYDSEKGELTLYGKNSNGNLGTGNNNAVKKENAIKINSKIGNKKIIDYLVTKDATFVLTNEGKVYTTGIRVPDGVKAKRNTFINVVLYKSYYVKDINSKDGNSVTYNTNNSKIKYISNAHPDSTNYSKVMHTLYSSKLDNKKQEVIINRDNKFLVTYLNETKKKKVTITHYDGKGQKNRRVIVQKKNKHFYTYNFKYLKNKIIEKAMSVDFGSTGRFEKIKYKDGKKTFKEVKIFEFNKSKLRDKNGISAKIKYYYKNNKIALRKKYKVNKRKKLVLVSITKYTND